MTRIAQELPKVGLVMQSVKVICWRKEVGDVVTQGETLLEVETEKSIVEIEAGVSGRLAQILTQVDEEAAVGDVIAWIESAEAQAATPETSAAVPSIAAAPPAAPSTPTRAAVGDRVRATPVARRLAAAHGLDIATLAGSGPAGRVQLKDVQKVVDVSRADTRSAQTLSPMRRALARAMTLSNATIPQFMVSRSVDWTGLMALRGPLSAKMPVGSPKLTINDFLLQAVGRSLCEFPGLNATFVGNPDSGDAHIEPSTGAHIGLVVAVDDGLLVPVIHDVDRLGLAEIARRRLDGVERALNGRLKRDEVGATFSISNLGAEGPDRFSAIINPPQSAILAVGRQRDCVVVRQDVIVVRPLSELTLTVDHRVADGRLASRFLARVVLLLEASDWRLE